MHFAFRKNIIMLGLAALSQMAFADEYSDVTKLMRAGQNSEALARADQYLAGKPKDPQMRFLKGVTQAELGKPADAINTFTKLTEDYPELPEPYNNLAVIYASQNQYDKARAALEMAIRTNPSYATAHENLGDVYARLASQAYSKALQLDSSNTGVQPKLALIRDLFAGTKGTKVAAAAPAPAPVAKPAPSPAPAAAPAPAAKPAPAPAAATPSPAPTPTKAAAGGEAKDVEAAVNAWVNAWGSKDMKAYLAAYGSDFDNGGKSSRKEWEEDRRARIMGKSSISVKISQLQVSVNGSKATAKFRQEYKADKLAVSSHKTLELTQSGASWLIVREKSK